MTALTKINTLILGQTGAGKSTLINYIAGDKKVVTGIGKPKTPKGAFDCIEIPAPKRDGVTIVFYDSWGLEANHAEEWKAMMKEKLSDVLSYSDMIHGIVYCLSYSKDRIEDFEIAMVKELLNYKYKVIFAFTQADNKGFETKKCLYKDRLNKALSEYRNDYTIVDVCSESIKKLGKTSAVPQFGKEELLSQIERAMLTNLCNVFIANLNLWREQSLKKIIDFQQAKKTEIDNFYQFDPHSTVEKQAVACAERIQNEAETFGNDIFNRLKKTIEEMKDSYERREGSFTKINDNTIDWGALINIVPIAGQIIHFLRRQAIMKKRLVENLDEVCQLLRDKISKAYQNAETIVCMERLRYRDET